MAVLMTEQQITHLVHLVIFTGCVRKRKEGKQSSRVCDVWKECECV